MIRNSLLLVAFAFVLLASGGLPGCESMPLGGVRSDDGQDLTEPPSTGLVAKPRPLIPDVPMPVGFVAVPLRSSSYATPSGPRLVTHTYQGRGTVREGVQFYRQNLPVYGWQLVRGHSDSNVSSMVYVKGHEELSVEVAHPRVLDVVVRIKDRNVSTAAAAFK